VNSLVKETKARLYAPSRDVILKIVRALSLIVKAFPELAGTLAFVTGPLLLLLLLAMAGAYFPERSYGLNKMIGYGFVLIQILILMILVCEVLRTMLREMLKVEWRKKRGVWEEIFLRIWLVEVFGGIALGGFFYWLGVKGVWRPLVVDWGEDRQNFLCLYALGVGVSFFGIVGRLYLWEKTLERREACFAASLVRTLNMIVCLVGTVIPWSMAYILLNAFRS